MEVNILEVYGPYPFSYLKGGPYTFWCLNFEFFLTSEICSMSPDLEKDFLLGLGTKKSQFKKARDTLSFDLFHCLFLHKYM